MAKNNSRWTKGNVRYDKKAIELFAAKREDAGWVRGARVTRP